MRVKKSISKTDVKRGMATSNVIIDSYSDRALKLQNQGFYISTFIGHREKRRISSVQMLSKSMFVLRRGLRRIQSLLAVIVCDAC